MSQTPNPAAVALGKLRAKTLTTEHQATAARALAAGMTPEERSQRARVAARARHAKRKRKRKSARR